MTVAPGVLVLKGKSHESLQLHKELWTDKEGRISYPQA